MNSMPDPYARSFVQDAVGQGRPFFLMANSHDPHRPFYGNDREEWYQEGEGPVAVPPSRTFTPEEIVVPGFLPDLPQVRLEISEYYNSVRRCDDTVGRILTALEETGVADNTLVMFLSDNGMAFPFAKTNCYLNSTRTPWLARWPGQTEAGVVDRQHFISGVDFMPTVLEAAGIAPPEDMDGASFLPVLKGQEQDGREMAFTQFHQTSARRNYPMRCVQTRRFGYIFNPWSDGKYEFKNESQAGRSFNAMQEAAPGLPDVADRVRVFQFRVPEEFYDFERDPDGLKNLIDDPEYADEVERLRNALQVWMVRFNDPALEAFRNRSSREVQDRFMDEVGEVIGKRDE